MDIPKTLDEAVDILYNEFKEETQFYSEIKEGKKDIGIFHHTTGMWIRNNWGLWKGSELRDFFFNLGVFHADDMSGIIFAKVQAKIRGEEYDLEKEIKRYEDYWIKKGISVVDEIEKLKKQ